MMPDPAAGISHPLTMQEFDYVVIGGGIVGLSVAWTLLQNRPGIRVVVLEKEDTWARHQTAESCTPGFTISREV
jgi:glycine/D-amino acid oxidase-like deaminating enzyme